MPRQKSIVTVIRDMVKSEISSAFSSLLGTGTAGGKRRKKRSAGKGSPAAAGHRARSKRGYRKV